MSRILIISHDVVGKRMAGPAIRCWEFARVLSGSHQVTLAIPNKSDLESERFRMVQYDTRNLIALAQGQDAIIVSGLILAFHPGLKRLGIPLVVDIYDPFVLETLELLADRKLPVCEEEHDRLLAIMNDQLLAGDFFLCAGEQQRDYWLGSLSALNRINPRTHRADPTFRDLIAVVPFGLPSEEPSPSKVVLRGVWKGIAATDKIIIWAGGIYDWLDPLTLIKAMARIATAHSDVKLLFMGLDHPNPTVRRMRMRDQTIQLAQELGLHQRHVFFNSWVPYEERASYLLEADVGVTLQFEGLESHFACRARILDYIWTRTPIVATKGDPLSMLIERHRLGLLVDLGDADQVAEAILALLDSPAECGFSPENFTAIRDRLAWEAVTKPLMDFCEQPRRAADLERGTVKGRPNHAFPEQPTLVASRHSLLDKVWQHYRLFGFRSLFREARSYLTWLLLGHPK